MKKMISELIYTIRAMKDEELFLRVVFFMSLLLIFTVCIGGFYLYLLLIFKHPRTIIALTVVIAGGWKLYRMIADSEE